MTPVFSDQMFWDAQPPAVQALRTITDPGKRRAQAILLATSGQGYRINVPMMIWLWAPSEVMEYAAEAGDQWLPIIGMASLATTGTITREGPMPAGAFKVSVDPADYPPFPIAPQPLIHPEGVKTWVGSLVKSLTWPDGSPWWAVSAPGCPLPPGQPYVDPEGRGTFIFHSSGPFFAAFAQQVSA